jgi:hypothetical protein
MVVVPRACGEGGAARRYVRPSNVVARQPTVLSESPAVDAQPHSVRIGIEEQGSEKEGDAAESSVRCPVIAYDPDTSERELPRSSSIRICG